MFLKKILLSIAILLFSNAVLAAHHHHAKAASHAKPVETAAAPVNSPAAQQSLIALLQNFQSMQANFTQTTTDNLGKVIQTSQGQMAIQRPGKFRWNITAPNPQLLIADGDYVWIYDASLQQATKQKISVRNATAASLLSGSLDDLQKQFLVAALPASNKGAGFILTPQDKNAPFHSINLYFQDKKLTQMQMIDTLGHTSRLIFTNIQLNPSLDNSLFQANFPKGTDVISE